MTDLVTLTLAPAIDRTYRIEHVAVDAVHRAREVTTELSGKGVNVAAAARLVLRDVRAVVPLGPGATRALCRPLADVLVPITVPTGPRVNTSIIADDGTTTKINEAPLPLSPEAWDALVDATRNAAADAGWLVIAGSIPILESTGERVPIVELARAVSAPVALDTAGAALADAVAHADAFALLKPNTHELAAVTGRSLATIGEVTDAAREIIARGCPLIYVSMGADGALAVTADGVWHAQAAATPVNSAGAGDASLAGFLVGGMRSGVFDVAAAVQTAASWGAVAVATASTVLPSLAGAPIATVTDDPDPHHPLTEPAVADGTV